MNIDDIMADLFDAIEAIPDCPDLETTSAADVIAMGAALGLAVDQLREAVDRWQSNARIVLPEWEDHYDPPARPRRRAS